jgi:(1->4)-alpha-D-glucan 1-alpha-D-glucosylmutase
MIKDPANGTLIPSSTYRLQLNSQFGFGDARELAPYLASLGMGAAYVSPILAARPGSPHGYDATDHSKLNTELGTEEDFGQLASTLQSLGMGLIVDLVPNHVSIADPANWRWLDVLENGPSSIHARFFDIDWKPPREDLADKILLPILGDQYGKVLENQEIQIEYRGGAFVAKYYEVALPVAPKSTPIILEPVVEDLRSALGEEHEFVQELESIITALRHLPPRTETDEELIRERNREREIIKKRVAALVANEEVDRAVQAGLRDLNGTKGNPASFDRLERLLADQAYRLSYWRVAADEINYRRFFDVNDLAAIRIEDPAVFQAVNERILEFVGKGWITGLRIDHPDGLFDPAQFFRDLQRVIAEIRTRSAAPETGVPAKGFYVVAEKIVLGREELRADWAIHGTTGYGFLNLLNGVFVRPEAKKAFLLLYDRFTDVETPSFENLVYESKRLILRVSLSSELNVLARRLDRICQQHRHTRDFTLESLRFALREIIACMPVYRTYIRGGQEEIDPQDRQLILSAAAAAKRRNPATSESTFDAISSILQCEYPDGLNDAQRAERILFVMRVQQLTGPVMAKGVEDTAFYRWYPLASLNEVGGQPDQFGSSLQKFHSKNAIRADQWPHALNATATHDTKRGEDVRSRLNVLSEIPSRWYAAIQEWHRLTAFARQQAAGVEAPDRNVEYLFFQTLAGTWPMQPMDEAAHGVYVDRIQNYMVKALHEAKIHTSWINPNHAYDEAIRNFVALALDREKAREFLSHFTEFLAPVIQAGVMNSLSQTLLKIACPGVPDFYQGTEMWDLSLVDPDNRRPVDYRLRAEKLRELDEREQAGPAALVESLLRAPSDGLIKLYVTSRCLRFRRSHEELFACGNYTPLLAAGPLQKHVAAFAREHNGKAVTAVGVRFHAKLFDDHGGLTGAPVWTGTTLPVPPGLKASRYRDVLTGGIVDVAKLRSRRALRLEEVFRHLPAALLQPET